ncbi:redoxin domain-containing protein [Hymenobacter sp. NST-14]|uniref:redoxin domain-containing protein n=1 Tax=Hymenobacter piscis TaxID=2839984 RepID=UPI001C021201|nr:redoxin domain-containing protein [Hymenobacter piscis]MBT9391687.1 redoxin domain-containing protein [Hymenobacter piscis]
MSLRRISLVAAAALLFCAVGLSTARAQGRSVANFSLKNATNTEISLKGFSANKAVVVVFINPNCAFSKLYQNRLAALNANYGAKGVQFLFVNTPINLEASAESAAVEKIKIKVTGGAELPLLTDEGQQVSTLLGATKTPEVVVLQPAGGGFAVRYKGAIDDNPQIENYVKEKYLEQVLDNLLAGRPAGVADKRAAGCLIKRF